MRLFHFTAGEYLRGIARYGLTVGDVPTDFKRNAGRVGVWLTSSPTAVGHGLVGSALAKGRFRLGLDISAENVALRHWPAWADTNVTPETRAGLHRVATAEGADVEATWFVFFGIVKPEWVAEVTDMTNGMSVPGWGTFWPEADSLRGIAPFRRDTWHRNLLKGVERTLRHQQTGPLRMLPEARS